MENDTAGRILAFFPWLRLEEIVTLGRIRFVPFEEQSPTTELATVSEVLTKVLSSYRDLDGKPIHGCTVACVEGKDPIEGLNQQECEDVRIASQFLSLAAIARNEYFNSLGSYANSTCFQPIFQSFTIPVEYITLQVRRRDGYTLVGGYRHGQVSLSVPLQCTGSNQISIDRPFAEAMGKALLSGSSVAKRLIPAVSFFNLASTDSGTMASEAEVILTASAFDQLLNTSGAYDLSCKVGNLLKSFGTVKVEDGLKVRQGIKICPKYEAAQRQWFLHRKWAEELYDLRSDYVHGNDTSKRTWGWTPSEHLVMGAFVFPLLVKICLSSEGLYTFSEEDEVRCRAIDCLLSRTDWDSVVGNNSMATVWRETVREVRI